MKNVHHFFTVALLCSATIVFAQDDADDTHDVTISVDEVFIMDIESSGDKNISLNLEKPDEAGEVLAPSTNTTIWVNYTSVVDGAGESRNITAQTSAATAGYVLKVEAGADASQGGGTVGASAGEVTLSDESAQNVITGIGSAYTGTGASNGHNLTYTLESAEGADFSNLDHTNEQTITVTYTITD